MEAVKPGQPGTAVGGQRHYLIGRRCGRRLGAVVANVSKVSRRQASVTSVGLLVLALLIVSTASFWRRHMPEPRCRPKMRTRQRRLASAIFGARWKYFLTHRNGDLINVVVTETQRLGGAFYQAGLLLTGIVHGLRRCSGAVRHNDNHRSRPELLRVVNELFASEFGDDFQRLEAAGRFPNPAAGPAVELLVTDKQSYKGTDVLAPRRSSGGCAARTRALRQRGGRPRLCCLPVRGRDGRRRLRGTACGRRPAHVPRGRSRLLRAAAGQRSRGVPASAIRNGTR